MRLTWTSSKGSWLSLPLALGFSVLWGLLFIRLAFPGPGREPLLRPWFLSELPSCPLRSITGVPCPGCGTTRAFQALARSEPLEALALNPLVTLMVLGSLIGGAVALGALVRRRRPVLTWSVRELRVLRWGGGAVLLLNWIYLLWTQG